MKLKKRGLEDTKKILIYGNDGSGKSTFAETYCREHNLKPIVIDIDDTNYTNCDILDLQLTNDLKTFNSVKFAIEEIGKSKRYDTIILDGVSSLIEMLVSRDKGIKKYEVRNDRFKQILKAIRVSGKHIIFVGQADMKVVHNDDYQSNKLIVKVNSIVNEKYHTILDSEGNYSYEVEKFREVKKEESSSPVEERTGVTVKYVDEKEEVSFNTANNISTKKPNHQIIAERIIKSLGNNPTKKDALSELDKMFKDGLIAQEDCIPVVNDIEVLLNGTA